ncbi:MULTISPECIES: hypothetical protein [unclassified Halomonas]|uniref:Uncharacterized protein n=1 Tax=Halomonas sp. H10-59 TaxID=2950874 RepID=A0AAU7KQ06_9GAMM|nr:MULTISPECIES: hypothetical protein [unclassified Halomonas]MAR74358.1 hypothetical protein [Halomonas sp.]MBR9878691.1 hypothetical protein [Gammaproteobacteria bacterium]MBS8267204.1 hypothetical protein [Halomonas litopenaei]|tara:strand:- start:104 stop:322 length:219 start_codon:yes stop_codon:yes gene_type:complete
MSKWELKKVCIVEPGRGGIVEANYLNDAGVHWAFTMSFPEDGAEMSISELIDFVELERERLLSDAGAKPGNF